MTFGKTLRRYWPETIVVLAVALPWLSLLVLGSVWLWQGGRVWEWALAAAALGLLAVPFIRLVRRRADAEAKLAVGDLAEPARGWSAIGRDAWSDVLKLADTTQPFSFAEIDPLVASARTTIEAVARRFHPESHNPWAHFNLPEVLLLAERLCRDVRREALQHVPGVRTLRLSHVLWLQRQNERYGVAARISYGVWRMVRALINPLAAAGSETSGVFVEKAASVLSYRLRVYATRMLVLEVGRAAIDLYSGRLALSDDEMRAAQALDAADSAPLAPVRIVLAGQVNAGKSSLLNALAQETRSAVGPLPTTSRAAEYCIELEGRPAVSLVDMPGLMPSLGDSTPPELLGQAERADLVVWVVSAVQTARGPDRQSLDGFRAWAAGQLARRTPPVVLALTHVDELRPAIEWTPPYDVAAPAGPKARSIRAAMDAVARALDVPADAIVPVAMPPGHEPYNLDALWGRLAVELDEAKLVQLDRLRIGHGRLDLRELMDQLGHAGRVILKGIVKA
jgi:predicted GTPase